MNLSSLLNRKRIIGIFVALILLTAIPATLLLTKSSQDIRQRASENTIIPISNGIAIKGYLYIDEDRNRIFSPQEKGVAMANIQLLSPDKKTVAQTTTDELGYYEFKQLHEGHYILHLAPPSNIKLTDNNDLPIDTAVLSDAILYNFPTIDIDKNLYDLNENGIFDSGDLGILTACIRNSVPCDNIESMDYRHDGILDGADLNIMQRAYKVDLALNVN